MKGFGEQGSSRYRHPLRDHSAGCYRDVACPGVPYRSFATSISIITRFEILRGLNAKNATTQIAAFHALCQSMEVLPITDDIIVRAAEIYGKLHRAGQLVGDADILIAATCMEHGCEIVTNNTAHFSRMQGLLVDNWLAQQTP